MMVLFIYTFSVVVFIGAFIIYMRTNSKYYIKTKTSIV